MIAERRNIFITLTMLRLSGMLLRGCGEQEDYIVAVVLAETASYALNFAPVYGKMNHKGFGRKRISAQDFAVRLSEVKHAGYGKHTVCQY